MGKLERKIALIIGGNCGIGRSTAVALEVPSVLVQLGLLDRAFRSNAMPPGSCHVGQFPQISTDAWSAGHEQ